MVNYEKLYRLAYEGNDKEFHEQVVKEFPKPAGRHLSYNASLFIRSYNGSFDAIRVIMENDIPDIMAWSLSSTYSYLRVNGSGPLTGRRNPTMPVREFLVIILEHLARYQKRTDN